MRRFVVFLSGLFLAVGWSVTAGLASAAAPTVTFTVHATSAAEVHSGPAGATAAATLTINRHTGQLCFQVSVSNLSDVTDVHLHHGPAGADGPLVTMLDNADSLAQSGGQGCNAKDLSAATVRAIVAHPGDYYLNVHTKAFETGAVRGQLTAAPDAVNAGSGGQAAASGHDAIAIAALVVGALLCVLCLAGVRRTARLR